MTFETCSRIFRCKADDAFHCQWSQALGAGMQDLVYTAKIDSDTNLAESVPPANEISVGQPTRTHAQPFNPEPDSPLILFPYLCRTGRRCPGIA